MVKETAAERRAREATELALQNTKEWEEFTAGYPSNFANLIFRYMELEYAGFRVKKLDDETYNFSRNDYSWKEFTLKVTPPTNYMWEYLNDFDNAYGMLKDYAAEVAEAERKHQVRQAALAKLTEEERELLGI